MLDGFLVLYSGGSVELARLVCATADREFVARAAEFMLADRRRRVDDTATDPIEAARRQMLQLVVTEGSEDDPR